MRKFSIALLSLAFVLAACYLALAEYYKGGFSYGTWINGIYCTGKTVDEVNQELLETCTYEGLKISDKEGNAYEIKAEDIGFAFDFRKALSMYLDRQNPYLWIDNLFSRREHTLIPVISYEEDMLETVYEQIPFLINETVDGKRDVYLMKASEGYVLVNERVMVLNTKKARKVIEEALLNFSAEVNLEEKGCYEDLPLSAEEKQEILLWEKIKDFQDCRIVYAFGKEQVPINGTVVCDWIQTEADGSFSCDETGNLIADEEKIDAFVDRLADEYDTVGGSRNFQATRGEIITVEGGTYGNKMNRTAEKEYLKKAFLEKREEIHIPEYTQEAWLQGKDDIGQTYIEVDMTKQMLYYYIGGRLELETQVVTGNTGRRMGTPEGVNFVYGKQKNRILKGPNYASHVNFWMPVKGNIGIHDAKWRSEFGGEIYKSNGSHGCINVPYEAMSQLYEIVEIGTPVIMFY